VGGLAEVMDFPAVKNGDPDMLQKIADTLAAGKQVDGHTSGLSKADLDVYRRYGIATDHESLTVQEATDRVDAGFYVYLREGTVERDLAGTIGAVNDANWHRFALCTDDKTVASIVDEGGVDFTLKKAMTLGMTPERAYTMCTYNAAKSHLINDLGAIVPGFKADLVVVDDLREVSVARVMKNGAWVDQIEDLETTPWPYQTMNYRLETLDRPLVRGRAHVIGIRPNHIDTEHLVLDVPVDDQGLFVPSPEQDLAKIVNVERHRALGSYVGILQGLKLSRGAVAISVGHDSHNLLAVGMDDDSIRTAIDAIGQVGGGYAVVDPETGQTTVLPLEIAGLMSNKPYLQVADQYRRITAAFKESSSVEFDPFLTMAFLSLPVIPSLKITDQGLFDYEVFDFIDINA
jgi:adenine deaminase